MYIYYNKRREWNKTLTGPWLRIIPEVNPAAKYQELGDWLIDIDSGPEMSDNVSDKRRKV